MTNVYDTIQRGMFAVLLFKDGDNVGRIIGKYGRTGSFTCIVEFYNNSPYGYQSASGRAGGYGYDKKSTAIYNALKKMKLNAEISLCSEFTFDNKKDIDLNGKIPVYPGGGNERDAFTAAGFTWYKVL